MTRQELHKIVVTRPCDPTVLDALRQSSGVTMDLLAEGEATDRSRLLEAVTDADGIFSMISEHLDEELMRAAPRLRVISNMAVGYDNVDVEAATRRGIVVCNTPDVLTETTAELAIALMFAASRRVVEADRFVREGRWTSWAPDMLLGRDLAGARLGVVGAGRIGQAVAMRARALGMSVIYSSRSAVPELEASVYAERMDLDALLALADVVSLHVPLTSETCALIDRRRLALMKPTAILINTARGPVVDEDALASALANGRLFAAGLDVFEREPVVSPALLELDNAVLLPHIGSASVATRRRMAEVAAENLLQFLAGAEPLNVVNPTALCR